MGKWIHSWIGPDKNGYRPFWKGKFKCHMVYLDHRILLYNVYLSCRNTDTRSANQQLVPSWARKS